MEEEDYGQFYSNRCYVYHEILTPEVLCSTSFSLSLSLFFFFVCLFFFFFFWFVCDLF